MDPAKQQPPAGTPADQAPASEPVPPKDALEKTNEQLASEQAIDATSPDGTPKVDEKPRKAPGPLKKIFKKVDVYLFAFLLAVVAVGAFILISYLNSQHGPKEPTLNTEPLTPDALKALANSSASVGSSAQTLTVQGNAIFSNQVLIRGTLGVAGAIQSGVSITAPSITATASANLANTQVNSLQVAAGATVQGPTSLTDLTVSGKSTFGQPMTASQITVTNLILSGNAVVQVPNHLAFTGPTPHRTAFDPAVLGAGGTVNINGSDTSGTVNINSGNSPIAGCFVSITFAQPFAKIPRVIIGPVNAAAGKLEYYATVTTTGMSICTDNAATPNQVFAFNYFIAS